MRLPKVVFFLILSFFLFTPRYSYAAFNGGINIGPHLEEFGRAAQLSDWVYVMIRPDQIPALINLWNNNPDTNLIIRGHSPDSQGSSLTVQYAQEWAAALETLPRPVYFMPINEPNNPNESIGSNGIGGIPADKASQYVFDLYAALNQKGLLSSDKVFLLSPAFDVYQLYDNGVKNTPNGTISPYIENMGGWEFFRDIFDGIALNLYGEFINGSLEGTPAIKKGQNYDGFLVSNFGAPANEAKNVKIFALETGAKIANQPVRYSENSGLIIDYLKSVKDVWGRDPNFIMYSIFSYDPAKSYEPWIYDDSDVLEAMELNPANTEPTIAPPSANTNPVIDMYNITKRSNSRLLPQSIQDKITISTCVGGINILGNCIFGEKKQVTYQNINTGNLAGETQNFQPIYVPGTKVVNAEKKCGIDNCALSNLFQAIIAPQMSDKLTGSLNAYCPSGLNCNQKNIPSSNNSSVLAGETSKPQEVVNSYNFTMKMLLPASIGGTYADIPAIESPTPIPTSTPVPTISTIPTISPTSTPIPSVTPPPSTDITSLKDPDGSYELKQLIAQASDHFKIPQAVIAAVSWIEGAHIWYYDGTKTSQYMQPGAQDPKNCSENPWTAAGPMQFTRGQWEPPPPAYKEAVKEATGQQDRVGDRCNLMDSFWGAAKKLKDDSSTGNNSSLNWDKAAVANAGYHYYGLCGRCPFSNGDPELNLGRTDIFACIRFRGKSYCEYMWDYYQCNDNSATTEEFISCAKSKGLETGVRKFTP
ncbi:hypothetical protein HYT02_00860 [Candidatus Gottesmanbacteria bacterium]|nr:hypothetical protein [Candidatus Gottesmanbacteria bacterium]